MFLIHDHPSHGSIDDRCGPDMVDIGITVLDDIGVITVIGELDVSNSATLHNFLQRAMDTGLKEIVVDIEHLSYLDSSGLAVLWKAHKRMDTLGGHLVVFGPTPNVVRLLDVTGMGWLLNVRSAAG
jgi:anti-anti-sigma factor